MTGSPVGVVSGSLSRDMIGVRGDDAADCRTVIEGRGAVKGGLSTMWTGRYKAAKPIRAIYPLVD